MYKQTFAWGRSKKRFRRPDEWVEWLWIVGLLLAAVLLFGINLGGAALRDWDEGIVAQVARDIWQAPSGSLRWLYPTLGGEPYLNKPPLMHWLIALTYSIGGVNEWTTRLPGAMLTALSVPLLYCIGREIFHQRLWAIFSALTYLTMLPVVRHGRLAMLDGAVECFFLLMIWCLLRSRRDLRYCLGVGFSFGLICLTKGIMGALLGAIALAFLFWDTPRLLSSWYMWIGVLLGSADVIFWYGAQWLHYGQTFSTVIVDQSLGRVWTSVENHTGPAWYYLLEICEYAWPWLLFLPQGLRLTWSHRNLSWAKLVLVWGGIYLLAISAMETKLPWYVLPLYPAVAIATGVQLAEAWQWRPAYPRAWVAVLALLALGTTVVSFYFSPWGPAAPKWQLQVILAAVGATMTLAAILAALGDKQFISILFWGSYVSLLLLMASHHWVWELAETYPVKPVAEIVRKGTPVGQKVYTSYHDSRPSLNFYSDRQVIPVTGDASRRLSAIEELQQKWQQDPQPYFLLDRDAREKLDLTPVKLLGTAEGWTLMTKNRV
ncbi:MAG: glycosyltransferase family 39 protein [Chroococcidiopsidaceae cyanobacterium CP_BM_ER_R8_30]|nr:glycosyltransferase family 39 protein [Chroococcidiopsidaceae cyanobacterium CP_BM_ER_R8_30]